MPLRCLNSGPDGELQLPSHISGSCLPLLLVKDEDKLRWSILVVMERIEGEDAFISASRDLSPLRTMINRASSNDSASRQDAN